MMSLPSNLPLLLLLLLHLDSSQSQVANVGKGCVESTTCGTGAYCGSNKRCNCLSSYINIDGYCWRRINPGEAGCTHERQCEAVWPGSFCSSGTCRCANNQDPFPTPDGLVCVNYGGCPINGVDTILKEDDGTLSHFCIVTSRFGCPPTYDCVCKTPECLDIDAAFCCPSRALACVQPMDNGAFPPNGGGTVSRYFHDVITGQCKTFSYRGYKGNANNFETKEHCESYCTQGCERGRPMYSNDVNDVSYTTTSGLVITGPQSCSTSSTSASECATNFECTSVGTRNYCCPTVDFVCSKTGGVIYDTYYPAPTGQFDVGESSGFSTNSRARFYYDRSTSRCRPFNYLGQAGNFNNFRSESACELYCSKTVCDAGLPMKDSTGVQNLNCGGSDSNCPTTHQCNSNMCCPKPQFVCKQPMGLGSCASFAKRWWFNANTGNCEQFTYSGCQGNANNFATYTDCQSFCQDTSVEPRCPQGRARADSNGNFILCGGTKGVVRPCATNYYCYFDGNTYGCCPNQAYTCGLLSDEGRVCGPDVTRWYFDSTTKKCQTFSYHGCDGNSNNYATQQDCNEYCKVNSCPDGGEVLKERNGQVKQCSLKDQCPTTHSCTAVQQYTRAGFVEHFQCCPTKHYTCSLYKDEGTKCSQTTIDRYYFASATRTCEPFLYNGCAGNRNNFANKEQCQNYCLSSACSSGLVVQQDQLTQRITECSNIGRRGKLESGGCHDGFVCVSSDLLQQNVCCGAPVETQALCPHESMPYVSALTLEPMQCTPNVVGGCPGGYWCSYSHNSGTNAYYCCKEAVSEPVKRACPPGLYAMPGLGNEDYRQCSPNNGGEAQCGANGQCQYANSLAKYVCCAGSAIDVQVKPNICPPKPTGLQPLYTGGSYRACDVRATKGLAKACPPPSACLYTGVATSPYICCALKQAANSINQRHSQTTSAEVGNGRGTSEDCGGNGFLPVDTQAAPYPQACSPFVGDSCDTYAKDGATISRCVHSPIADKFICCRRQP